MIYFISDVHLGFDERKIDRQKEQVLIDFLRKIEKDCEILYILGDLFDYWFEYKTVIPKNYYRTLAQFSKMVDKNIKIEYLMGNHDFGHQTFFDDELNIKIYNDDIERVHNGKKFFLSHGDGKVKNDYGYMIVKKILRNRFAQWLYYLLHPDFAVNLASSSSKKSRKHTDKKFVNKEDSLMLFAKDKIAEGYDFVLMGHRHRPAKIQYGKGVYVNLGDWIQNPTFAYFNGNEIKLELVEDFLAL